MILYLVYCSIPNIIWLQIFVVQNLCNFCNHMIIMTIFLTKFLFIIILRISVLGTIRVFDKNFDSAPNWLKSCMPTVPTMMSQS